MIKKKKKKSFIKLAMAKMCPGPKCGTKIRHFLWHEKK